MSCEGFLQVALAKGVGDVAIKRIIAFLHDKGMSWNDFCCGETVLNEFFVGRKEIVQAVHAQNENAKRMAEKLCNKDIDVIFYLDARYPEKLKNCLGDNCPAFLFYKGDIEILEKESVGFCGSRNVSTKGISIINDCVEQLVAKDIIIVSGYAAGADLAAHRSAIFHSGKTVFVLAEGILRSSIKSEVKELLTDRNHVFISRYLPELTWNVGNAMKRNGVIIGLSDAMILVESGKTGGTFAAGNETLAVHRPLFVIDYAQPEVSAEANPYFISNGGMPIRKKAGIPNLERVFSTIHTNNSISESRHSAGEQLRLNYY